MDKGKALRHGGRIERRLSLPPITPLRNPCCRKPFFRNGKLFRFPPVPALLRPMGNSPRAAHEPCPASSPPHARPFPSPALRRPASGSGHLARQRAFRHAFPQDPLSGRRNNTGSAPSACVPGLLSSAVRSFPRSPAKKRLFPPLRPHFRAANAKRAAFSPQHGLCIACRAFFLYIPSQEKSSLSIFS